MFLGIDIGTSSVKLLLLDDLGSIINTCSKKYPCYYPKAGYSEQDPKDWWDAVKELIISIPSRDKIKAISFSGQMHGLIILDKFGNVIRPAILWNDQRSFLETEYLNDVFGKEKLVELTGNIAFTGFTAPKLLWVKNNEGENFKRIDKVLLPKDYIIYRFTNKFFTDVSDASGTLYFDVKNRCWSEEMLKEIDISSNQLPRVCESAEVIGVIDIDVASELGLTSNVKIIAGAGDQAAGAIGTGCVLPGDINISLGTSGVVFACLDKYVKSKNPSIHNFAHANNQYHYMGVILSAALSLDWWVKGILETEYDKILSGISKQKIDESLLFLPYLNGERSPINDPYAKGVFFGISHTTNKFDLARAVLEGICFALKESMDIILESIEKYSFVQVTGGGSNSMDWVQILADILQMDINVLKTSEGPAFGAALLAKAGYENKSITKIAKEFISVVKTIKHDESVKEIYQDKYLKYKKIYENNKMLFR